jgi:hypothetical protein
MTASPLIGALADCKPRIRMERGGRTASFRPFCDCGWTHWELFSVAEIAYQRAERHVRQQAETSSEKVAQP